MSDDHTRPTGRFLIKGRWINFAISLILGFVGWLPVLAGGLIAGLGSYWAGFLPTSSGQVLRVLGTASFAYLIVTVAFACRNLIPLKPLNRPWHYWQLLYGFLSFAAALAAGAAFGIASPFLVAYAASAALIDRAISLAWLKPWQPGPSEELLAARRAAYLRGEDPSKITEDDIT